MDGPVTDSDGLTYGAPAPQVATAAPPNQAPAAQPATPVVDQDGLSYGAPAPQAAAPVTDDEGLSYGAPAHQPPVVPSGEHGYTPQDLNPQPPQGDDYSPLDLPKQTIGKLWQDIKTLDPNTLGDIGSAVMAVPQMVAEPIGNAIGGEAGRNAVGATLEGMSAIPDLNLLHGITEKPPSNAVLETAVKDSAVEAPKPSVPSPEVPIEPANVAQQPQLPPAEAASAPKAVPPHEAAPEASAPLQPAVEPPPPPVEPRQQPGDQPAPPGVAENTAAPIPPAPPAVDPAVEAARRRDAAAAAYEGAGGTFSNTPAPAVDGALPVDEFGFVQSDRGGPIIFKSESQAANWIEKSAGTDQELAVEPHPSGKGFTVAEAAKPEVAPAGDAFKAAEPVAEAPPAGDETPARPLPRAREPVPGTGEEKPHALAESVESRMGQDMGDLPTHQVAEDAVQLPQVRKVFDTDPQRAMDIAMGKRNPPKDLLARHFYAEAVNRADAAGDFETARKLATESKLVGESTRMGQEISALRNVDPDSPTVAVQALHDARQAELKAKKTDVVKETAKTVAAEAPRLRAHTARAVVARATRETWEQFAQQIRCK